MYADDTTLLLRQHLSGTVVEVLGNVAKWFKANHFKLNVESSQSLQFTTGVTGRG